MQIDIIRATALYAAVAGTLSASSTIIVEGTALAADAAIYVPWLTFLALVVASLISLFLLQRSRPQPKPRSVDARGEYGLGA